MSRVGEQCRVAYKPQVGSGHWWMDGRGIEYVWFSLNAEEGSGHWLFVLSLPIEQLVCGTWNFPSTKFVS